MISDAIALTVVESRRRVAGHAQQAACPIQEALSVLARARLPARAGMLVVACVGIGTGVATLLQAGMGAGPYDVLLGGVAATLRLPFAAVAAVVGVAAVAIGRVLGARVPLGTLLVAVAVGPVVDLVRSVLPAAPNLLVGVAMAALGMAVLAVSIATLMSTRLGGGPLEVLTLGLTARGLSLRWSRTGLDVGLLGTGLALGGQAGAVTILLALGLGHVLASLLPGEVARGGARLEPAG